MKYGTDVDDAIAEACARRERPSQVLVRLRAGTLPGIDGPVPEIADRTFYGKWSRAKRQQKQGAPDDGPSILDMITADLMRRGEGSFAPGIEDPDEIAKRLGVDAKQVREWFAELDEQDREREQREQRPDPLAEHQAKVKRGKAMIAEGSSLEEAAEAMGENVHNAAISLRSALAEREEKAAAAATRNGAAPGG